MKKDENVVLSEGDISNNLTNKDLKISNNLTNLNIHNSKEEEKEPIDVSLNLNGVAAANDTDDVDIDDGDHGSNIPFIHSRNNSPQAKKRRMKMQERKMRILTARKMRRKMRRKT